MLKLLSPSETLKKNERERLLAIAYGHLGSLVEGEDIVQDALLRFAPEDRSAIRNAEAWLTTVVTRLCIDELRSARRRREVYPGEWPPEPVFDAPTPEQNAITRSRLSIGLRISSRNRVLCSYCGRYSITPTRRSVRS